MVSYENADGSAPATQRSARGDHDLCLSLPHYTDTDPISRAHGSGSNLCPHNEGSGALSTEPPLLTVLALEDNLSDRCILKQVT